MLIFYPISVKIRISINRKILDPGPFPPAFCTAIITSRFPGAAHFYCSFAAVGADPTIQDLDLALTDHL